jgi:hypothetical protein
MSAPNSTNIHRYLDEVFAEFPRTPESADLKEELRGNLQSRVSELESAGTAPDAAAAKAIREVGDIRALINEIHVDEPAHTPGDTAARLVALNRVKISAPYVVRTVLLALLLAAGVILDTLGATHVLDWPVASLAVVAGLSGIVVGLLTVDALVHETAQHFAMPVDRAVGFGAAGVLGLAGLGLVGIYLGNVSVLWLLITGCALALVALVVFIGLGVTQTNRQKPWVQDLNKAYAIDDRFSNDPAAAARFGLYTVIIWVLAIGAFIGLSIAVGFVWSWVALVIGLVVFMLVLVKMLFPAETRKK